MKQHLSAVLIAGALLTLPVVSHAALIDDFEGYAVGNASNASPPWATSESLFYGEVLVDPLDSGNQYLGAGSNISTNGHDFRDLSRPLGFTYAGTCTLEMDIIATSTNVNHSFGLSSSTDYDGSAPGDWYGDYGPYCRLIASSGGPGTVELSVRDGNFGFIDDLAYLPTNEWHTIRMEIDFDAQTWDLYLDDIPYFFGLGFRRAISDTDTFLIMTGFPGATNHANAGVDNLQFTGTPNSLAIGPTDPLDGSVGVTNTPTITQIVYDGTSELDTNSISFMLDGTNVAFSVSGTGTGTNTISHVVTTPFAPSSTHTALVSVAGINPVSGTISNQWTFTVADPPQPVPTEWTLFEDFEAYSAGTDLATLTTNKWLEVSSSGAALIATNGTNNWLEYTRTNLTGGAYADLGTNVTSGLYWIQFEMWADASGTDMSAGLANGGAGGGWGDFVAYVAVVGGDLRARNGANNETVLPDAFSAGPDVKHQVVIRADADAGWYDVYFDGELVADNFAFRNTGGINAFRIFSQSSTTFTGTAGVDNIEYSDSDGVVTPPLNPFNITSISYAGANVDIVWESQAGATYNILSKTNLTEATWTMKMSGIASAGDGTTSALVTAGSSEEFFTVEGSF